jgi:hypothetical protein
MSISFEQRLGEQSGQSTRLIWCESNQLVLNGGSYGKSIIGIRPTADLFLGGMYIPHVNRHRETYRNLLTSLH